jgi:hypothetical protein
MNLSPDLEEAIAQIAKRQGISPEEFIVQTLTEKIRSLQPSVSTPSTSQTGLRQKEGLLVFETESLDHIDFNALIAQIREERDWKQILVPKQELGNGLRKLLFPASPEEAGASEGHHQAGAW